MKQARSPFQKAAPVWVRPADVGKGPDAEWLRVVQFCTTFKGDSAATLVIAGWTSIRAWVNGHLVFYGPARAAQDHFRWESVPLKGQLKAGNNSLVIEVVSYGIPTFSFIHQDPFLQAELIIGGKVVAATAPGSGDFQAREVTHRRRHVQRYSYMRGFSEAYDLKADSGKWNVSDPVEGPSLPIIPATSGTLLPRVAPSPELIRELGLDTEGGSFTEGSLPPKPRRDRTLDNIGKDVIGWKESEFSVFPWNDWQKLTFSKDLGPQATGSVVEVKEGQFLQLNLNINWTGLIEFKWSSQTGGTLYLAADEIKGDEILNPLRDSCLDIIQIDFGPGDFHFLAAEPTVFKHLAVVVVRGQITIDAKKERAGMAVVTVQHPRSDFRTEMVDKDLTLVSKAAYQTLLANSFDFFTDCPGRERAGYPCDSFFTARAAFHVHGNSKVEEAFLENFALAPGFAGIPEGMMPMCYPADALGGTYIPQWPIWLLVQCGEFRHRSQNHQILKEIKPKFDALLKWLEPYRNEFGLLESMPGWNFIEWSGANNLVGGVHFPTNMLYAGGLDAYKTVYGADALHALPLHHTETDKIRAKIHEMAYDGSAYRDHAIRVNGKLEPQPECSDVCQSFAFFFGIASPQTDGALWKAYCEKKGIAKTFLAPNLFIGDVLRLELLTLWREFDLAAAEIKAIFLPMAQKTGTLWEMEEDWASCCHGFASYLAVIIDRLRER